MLLPFILSFALNGSETPNKNPGLEEVARMKRILFKPRENQQLSRRSFLTNTKSMKRDWPWNIFNGHLKFSIVDHCPFALFPFAFLQVKLEQQEKVQAEMIIY